MNLDWLIDWFVSLLSKLNLTCFFLAGDFTVSFASCGGWDSGAVVNGAETDISQLDEDVDKPLWRALSLSFCNGAVLLSVMSVICVWTDSKTPCEEDPSDLGAVSDVTPELVGLLLVLSRGLPEMADIVNVNYEGQLNP